MVPATAAVRSASRLLSLLHLLRLLRVSLRQLLRLLLVLLLHLLHPLRGSLLLHQALMFLVLLLLKILSILGLLRDYLLLLLLIFLVDLRVSCVGSDGTFDGRQLFGMDCKVGARSRGDWRRAAVLRNPLLWIIVGSPCMLRLSGHGRNMSFMSGSLFLSRGALVNSTIATVVADAVHPLIYSCVVSVVDDVVVHVIYCRVVEEMPVVPAPAFITVTEVTVAVVNTAIETYGRAPIARIENIAVAAPAPIARSPKETDLWSQHPCARHPVIFTIPSPIPWRPNITVARANRLIVNGQLRRRDCHGYADLRERRRRQE